MFNEKARKKLVIFKDFIVLKEKAWKTEFVGILITQKSIYYLSIKITIRF